MSLESVTAEYLRNLTGVGSVYGLAAMARAGVLDAYYAQIIAFYDVTQGGLLYTGAAALDFAATAALPVVAQGAVFAALGAGYKEARDAAKNENTSSGFSQGFVAGLLGWEWRFAVDRFAHYYNRANEFDEVQDEIRVNAFNFGLVGGWAAGIAMPPVAKKAYLGQLRKLAGVGTPAGWAANPSLVAQGGNVAFLERTRARNIQIGFVIALAAAARRNVIRH